MRQRYFITATGTDIGKTFITAALARQAKALGKSVAAYKPVISGFDPDRPEESDTGILLQALGLPSTPENIEKISPWRFREPLAPTMAAKLENRTLDFEALIAQTRAATESGEDVVLIEGVGGVMAPLAGKKTIIDWIEALGIETILVTDSYLGTLSHTLTALDALQRRKIPVFAIIVNESTESSVPLDATAEEIARFTRLPIVTVERQTKAGDIPALRALFT
jgi:dethiobiotin synthetase